MKLSDFHSKAPVQAKNSKQVFNLHNDYREDKLKHEIEVLELEIAPLRSLPAQILSLNENLSASERNFARIQKELTEKSEDLKNKELSNQKLLAQVKTFSELRRDYEYTLTVVASKESELQNELKIQKALVVEKDEALSYKLGLETKIAALDQEGVKLRQINFDITSEQSIINGQNGQLKDTNTKLNNELAQISKLNGELIQEGGYYKRNLIVAKQKIEELTYIKEELANWSNKLNKDYSQETSKKDALSKQIQDRDGVIADLSSNITEILASREELLAIVQYYKTELRRQRFVGADGLYRQVELPFASDIIKRRYVGTGKPTMLKFKSRGDINDDNAI